MNWAALIPDAPFDWALIPLNGRKRPIDPATGDLLEGWQNQPGYDVEGLAALNGCVKAAGLLLGPPSGGILAVDFDGPDAIAKFEEIYGRKPTELPPTIGVTSGKPGRGQRFFQVDQDWWPHLRGRRFWEHNEEICLELRWAGCQSVIAGAHPETGSYKWLPNSSPAEREAALAPDWLLEPLLRQEQHLDPVEPSTADAERAVAMLQCIDPAAHTSYDSWLDVGMALHHTDPGLLTAWCDWSRQMPNFDEAECLAKWESFEGYSGSRLTIRSLHHWGKQGGYQEPKRKTKQKTGAEPKGVAQGDLDGEIDDGPSPSELLGLSERLAEGRRMFSLKGMLPSELADALDVVQASLPTDPVAAVMPLLTGYSGLLKLNTRVASSYNFSKPVNLYSGAVLPSGLAKTPIKNNLLDDPAADIRKGQAKAHERAMTEWREQNKGKPKDEKTASPAPLFPHVTDYTPAALYNQLHAHEQRGLGVLILRDELSGLFGRVTADTNNGSGDGEAQLLELFDGDGYTGLRVTTGARHFDRCHVSLYGNIQPDVLKEIINGNDSTGKFARFLFFRVPSRPLALQDADPTEEERRQFAKAQQTLQDYAQKLFALPACTYEFDQTARTRFHAWFREHQHRSLLPGTPKVIQALLGKTSAHALRLAGILHILKVVDGEVAVADRITADTVDVAMAIVDQLTAETEAFHEQPAECDGSSAIELMRHIHNLSWFSQKPVTRQNCRDKGGRVVRRELKAPVYSQLVDEMVRLGYGIADKAKRVNGKVTLAYEATREMPE
jgi:hypothetical protein